MHGGHFKLHRAPQRLGRLLQKSLVAGDGFRIPLVSHELENRQKLLPLIRRHELARLNAFAVLDTERRAVRHLVSLALAAELVDDGELARARGRDAVALLLVRHGLDVDETDRAGALDLDAVDGSRARCRAADVERAHRELRARLADRLRRDDADGFAAVHAMTARQVAAVALRADAVLRLAGDRRTHEHLVDRVLLEHLDGALVEQRARLENNLVGARSEHVDGGRAA